MFQKELQDKIKQLEDTIKKNHEENLAEITDHNSHELSLKKEIETLQVKSRGNVLFDNIRHPYLKQTMS